MNLFEILKQFKNIQPDSGFSATSKRALLARAEAASSWSAKRTLFRILETGAAVTLTGFFVLLITGAFSGSRFAPIQYSAIDPQGLRAEAEAIDIQIQLANLNYVGPTAESTAQIAKPAATARAFSAITPATSSPAAAASTSTPTATSTLTIDQALEKLSN